MSTSRSGYLAIAVSFVAISNQSNKGYDGSGSRKRIRELSIFVAEVKVFGLDSNHC